MDLSKVSLLQSIAEKGSISAAAAERDISPVAAREQLGLIERELGFALFSRTRHGVSLTPEGKMFLESAVPLASEYDAIVAKCRALQSCAAESICIAVYEPYILFRYCDAYKKIHPNLSFSYTRADFGSANPAAFMKKNGIDVMQEAYSPDYEKENLRFLPVSEDHFCLYCKSSHPLASHDSIRLNMLQGFPVYYSQAVSCEGKILEANLRHAGIHATCVAHNEIDILDLCGKGAVYLLDSELQDRLRQLRCIPLEPKQRMVHGVIYAENASERVMEFIRYLQKIVGVKSAVRMKEICEGLNQAYQYAIHQP